MEPETLKALKASIKKWERNVAAKTWRSVRIDGDDCPLCTLLLNEENPGDCTGCPVKAKTGLDECFETPYYNARSVFFEWADGDVLKSEWQTAAQAEVDFLKSLLPEGETNV